MIFLVVLVDSFHPLDALRAVLLSLNFATVLQSSSVLRAVLEYSSLLYSRTLE
jgi:hypothetical protein